MLIIFPSEKDRDFWVLTYSSAYSLQNQQWSVQPCPQISHFYLLVTPFPAFILANKRCTHWKYTGFDFMTFKREMFKGMKNPVRSILFCENSKGNKLLTSVRVSANLPWIRKFGFLPEQGKNIFLRKSVEVNLEKLCVAASHFNE